MSEEQNPTTVRLRFTRGEFSFALSAPTQRAAMQRFEKLRGALRFGAAEGWTIESVRHDPLEHEHEHAGTPRGPSRLEFDAQGKVIR